MTWAEEESKGTVLITGANRGLGLEMAKQFLADNYQVYGTSRKPEKAIELKEAGATVLGLDVTSEESIATMVKTLAGEPIDILINNAGYFGPKLMNQGMATIDTLTRKEMEDCLTVNTMGPIFVTQALLPNLRAGGQKKVINISTRAGIIASGGSPYAYGYKVSKAALNMVTTNLSAGLQKEGFIVISLAPGHNKTHMGTQGAPLDPKDSMPMVKQLILDLKPEQSGGFWFYTGKRLPW